MITGGADLKDRPDRLTATGKVLISGAARVEQQQTKIGATRVRALSRPAGAPRRK